MKYFILLLSIISLILCGKSKHKSKNKDNLVKTPFGEILGKKITIEKEEVSEFLGVPYAYPPIGAYRFKRPIPLKQPAWKNTFNAIHKAAACPQIIRLLNFKDYDELLPHNGTIESCLKLNMWVPKGKNLPVLVVLHDGFYSIRTASVDRYYGAYLARKSKSIVITFNFRLGFFGFAYLGGGQIIPGNMGLLDQQRALKWIRIAIESFGGNKNSITLIGFGSGGSSVSAHLFSDSSCGLFHRAIMSSGTITNPLNTMLPRYSELNTRKVAFRLGCKGDGRQILACLQKKPTLRILRAVQDVFQPVNNSIPHKFLPVTIDNLFFKGNLTEKIRRNKFNNNVDLMIGITPDEASLLMATELVTNSSCYNCNFFPSLPLSDKRNLCNMNVTSFKEVVRLARIMLDLIPSEAKELFELYNDIPGLTYTQKSVRLLSDVLFNCEIYKFAVIYSETLSGNVYFYENKKRFSLSKWPSWTGVLQGDEINYIFAHPFRHSNRYNKKKLKEEQKYSDSLILLIKEFSRSGRPSKKWEKFRNPRTKALILDSKLNLKNLKQEYVLPLCPKVNRIIINARRRLQNEGTVPPTTITTTTQATTTTKKKGFFNKMKKWFKEHF